jgi:hypothetical protein
MGWGDKNFNVKAVEIVECLIEIWFDGNTLTL